MTLENVWNAFCDVLPTLFVSVPVRTCSFAESFGETSCQAIEPLLGFTGEVIWWVRWCIGWFTVYLPKKTRGMISSPGGSLVKGCYKLTVWLDPSNKVVCSSVEILKVWSESKDDSYTNRSVSWLHKSTKTHGWNVIGRMQRQIFNIEG